MTAPLHVLVIGSGPAGLAAALAARAALRVRGQSGRVVVIDKAPRIGAQAVSGAICDPGPLRRLLGSGCEALLAEAGAVPVSGIRIVALRPTWSMPLPGLLIPPFLRQGGLWVDLGRLCQALAAVAQRRGIEIYPALAAQELAWRSGRVIGALVGEGNPRRLPSRRGTSELIEATWTICADGAAGVVTSSLAQAVRHVAPQAWSLGLRVITQDLRPGVPDFEHLVGWPGPALACGGGFCYRPGDGTAHVGLILPLESVAPGVDSQAALRQLLAHPRLAARCGAVIHSAAARLLPEGGLAGLGPLAAPGALVVGDAAGLVDARRQRGVEWALASGLAAGAALLTADPARRYRAGLEALGVLQALRRGRNFRQVFHLPGGPLLAPIQELLPLQLPLSRSRRLAPGPLPVRDRTIAATFAAQARCRYPRHVLPHLAIDDPHLCQRCQARHGAPCLYLCPGGVFFTTRSGQVVSGHEHCLHCRSCAVICPAHTIRWSAAAEGGGPQRR